MAIRWVSSLDKASGKVLMYWGRYSEAPGANKKYETDKAIYLEKNIRGNLIDKHLNTEYWKAYIDRVSKKKVKVLDNSSGLQLFMINDGFEGFLPPKVKTKMDWGAAWASEEVTHDFEKNGDDVQFLNPLANNHAGAIESFDANDALVIVNKTGTVEYVFQLVISNIRKKDHLTGGTWHNKDAKIATPQGLLNYPGITIIDEDVKHGEKKEYIADIHGMIGSYGCVQVCPIRPDGVFSGVWNDKQWNDFTTQYLPNWESKPLNKIIGKIMMVGYA